MILSRSQLYMLDFSQNQHVVWAMGPLPGDNLHMKDICSEQHRDNQWT